jgi:hypothetical protein
VEALFELMKSDGVEPDAATFTIVVNQVLRPVASEGAEKQIAAVSSLLDLIEGTGQKTSATTFGKIIHVLLQGDNGGAEAVEYALERMSQQGMKPTPEILTMFVESYFSRNPPDVISVKQLIATRKLEAPGKMDGVFWEVVIKGYAEAGSVKEATRTFFNMNPHTRVTLGALDPLLKLLVKVDDMEGARRVVEAVLARREESDMTERDWKHRFWHTAAHYGLYSPEPRYQRV